MRCASTDECCTADGICVPPDGNPQTELNYAQACAYKNGCQSQYGVCYATGFIRPKPFTPVDPDGWTPEQAEPEEIADVCKDDPFARLTGTFGMCGNLGPLGRTCCPAGEARHGIAHMLSQPETQAMLPAAGGRF